MSSTSTHDRLHFCLFLASAVHASLIFGLGFGSDKPNQRPTTLEVTLAVHSSDKAPEKADFLAQTNQEGSGVLDEKVLTSTTQVAEFSNNTFNEIQKAQQNSSQAPKPIDRQLVQTTAQSQFRMTQKQQTEAHTEQAQKPKPNSLTLLNRSLEIASLEAQLREKRQIYAKKPRKRRLTALSAKAAADAAYLDAWRSKIETIGNSRYSELKTRELIGSLRLLVAINPDGTVYKISLLNSSGYKALDDAAIQVVRMAAPFAPFPEELHKNTDILEIIRTWNFEKGKYLSSH